MSMRSEQRAKRARKRRELDYKVRFSRSQCTNTHATHDTRHTTRHEHTHTHTHTCREEANIIESTTERLDSRNVVWKSTTNQQTTTGMRACARCTYVVCMHANVYYTHAHTHTVGTTDTETEPNETNVNTESVVRDAEVETKWRQNVRHPKKIPEKKLRRETRVKLMIHAY